LPRHRVTENVERAPVAVFAFKRLDLLKRTLAALERSVGFSDTTIHVFSDGARGDRANEESEVNALRDWARDWASGRSAFVHESKTNRGLRRSITGGINELLSSHDRVVVLEEDVIVSKWFLEFMNEALESFADRSDVFQVSGYFFPTSRKLPEIGLLRVPGSWGWGTWRRAWHSYRDDAAELLAEVRRHNPAAFDFSGAYGHLEALERNAGGSLDTWLVRWYASIFLRNGLCVYPGRSLTRNIGFDPRATNTAPNRASARLSRQRVATRRARVAPATVAGESPDFVAAIEAFYLWQRRQWTRPTLGERVRGKLRSIMSRDT
jgi:hypothetical protein